MTSSNLSDIQVKNSIQWQIQVLKNIRKKHKRQIQLKLNLKELNPPCDPVLWSTILVMVMDKYIYIYDTSDK